MISLSPAMAHTTSIIPIIPLRVTSMSNLPMGLMLIPMPIPLRPMHSSTRIRRRQIIEILQRRGRLTPTPLMSKIMSIMIIHLNIKCPSIIKARLRAHSAIRAKAVLAPANNNIKP
jgi:hypothetical protein